MVNRSLVSKIGCTVLASGSLVRRQLLDGVHNFHLSDGAEASVAHLRCLKGDDGRPRFNEKDMDYHEKQHWSGCLKIFSVGTLQLLQKTMDADPIKECRGTFAYVVFGLRLLNCCIGKQAGAEATDRKQAVVDAAFACAFALYWRYQVAHNLKGLGYTLKKHFLTRETFLDVMTITQTRILSVVLYRVWYPKYKIHAPNISSRFSEYVFQYARMHSTNSPLFDVAGFRRHLKHLIGQMKLAATTGLKVPAARRGVPHDVHYCEDTDQYKAPDGWHLTDEELMIAIDQGIAECVQLWIDVLGCNDLLDLSNPDHFFVEPTKHFPHGDMFAQGVDDPWYEGNAANGVAQEREDPGWNHDGDDVESDNPSAGNAADASQNMVDQWSNLIQEQGLVGAGAEAPESKVALLKQLSQPLSDWNAKYVKPKTDRVYGRFTHSALTHCSHTLLSHTDALMHSDSYTPALSHWHCFTHALPH